jgi:hypothetical protein
VSVRGRNHDLSGLPCQDYSLQYSDDDISLVVVSDGAGTAEFADYGAKALCGAVAEELIKNRRQYFPNKRLADASSSTSGRLSRKHRKLFSAIYTEFLNTVRNFNCKNARFKDFSATCLFACVSKGNFIAAHIGDGVIGIQRRNSLDVLSSPENGEFVNSTYFITSNDAAQHFRVYTGPVKPITGFVLMSDGAAESLYDSDNSRLAPVVTKIVDESEQNNDGFRDDLLTSMETVIKQATGDDCSIAVLTRSRKCR